jgi:hypothetical protein
MDNGTLGALEFCRKEEHTRMIDFIPGTTVDEPPSLDIRSGGDEGHIMNFAFFGCDGVIYNVLFQIRISLVF